MAALYVIGQAIIFSSCRLFFLLFSSPNLSGHRLDVYTILLHMAWPCEFRMQV